MDRHIVGSHHVAALRDVPQLARVSRHRGHPQLDTGTRHGSAVELALREIDERLLRSDALEGASPARDCVSVWRRAYADCLPENRHAERAERGCEGPVLDAVGGVEKTAEVGV